MDTAQQVHHNALLASYSSQLFALTPLLELFTFEKL